MNYFLLSLLIPFLCHAASGKSDKPVSWAAIESRLIEQNPTVPRLSDPCSFDRCKTIGEIYKQPFFCCEANSRENMLDQLSRTLMLDGHPLLHHFPLETSNRRALVERYLQHHKKGLVNTCCRDPFTPTKQIVSALGCFVCHVIQTKECPSILQTIVDQLCTDPDTHETLVDASALTAGCSCIAAHYLCTAGHMCCYIISDDPNPFGKRVD